jgi:hypothetical protein
MPDSQPNKKSAINTSTSVREQISTTSFLTEANGFLHETVAFNAIMDMAFHDRIGFVKGGKDVNAIIESLTEYLK